MQSIIDAVFDIFTAIAGWFIDSINSFVPAFYNAETGMTFLGVMTLCGLGVGVVLLLFNILKSFVRFK